MVALNFPTEIEVRGLVDYVSQRLGVKILYDDQVANKKISIKGPGEVPVRSLLGLLESALKMKGMALEDADVPGWKRIVATTKLPLIARTEQDAEAAIEKYGAGVAVTQAFLLTHADPQQVDTVIKPFLTQPGANSVAIKDPSVLIVTDYAANIVRVGKLVQLLDKPKPSVAVQFFTVKYMEASALGQQLASLFTARGKAAGSAPGGSTGAEIASDARTNQLLLVGTNEQIEEVLKLAKSLDVPLGVATQVYALRFVSAERVDRLLKELIDPIDAKRLFKSAVDADGNLLIVTGTPRIHEQVAAVLHRLDVAGSKAAGLVKFYKLKNVKATEVLDTIRAMDGKSSAEGDHARDDDARGGTRNAPAAGGNAPRGPMANAQAGGFLGGAGSGGAGGASPAFAPGGMNQMAGAGMGMGMGGAGMGGPAQRGVQGMGAGGRGGGQTEKPSSVELSNAKITADPNTNSIIIVAEPAIQEMYGELIQSLDRRRPQLLIEARIVTIDTSDNFSLGVDLSALSHNSLLMFTSYGLSKVDPVSGALSIIPGTGFNGAIIDPNSAQAVLQSLSSHSRAKVLSAPRILVNDNATGVLTSVSEVPYTSVNASQTVATTSFAGFAKAGTTIDVTPHIGEGDHVQLEYSVTLNSFTGTGSSGVPPPRQTDQVESKVVVPDGHTIIVGGLNRRSPSKSVTGLAYLSDIPMIGALFGKTSKSQQSTSMFVFLRPIILRDDKFQDLKYLSEADLGHAQIRGDLPHSEPLLMH